MALKIPLTGKYGHGKEALVDLEDYDKVSVHKWWLSKLSDGGYYVATWIQGKNVYLHRFILGINWVDHRNNNTLDNTRENLRPCSKAENGANKNKCVTYGGHVTASRYKGVYWSKGNQNWYAQIGISGKSKHLGTFETEVEAARAYNRAAVERFGEFARLNVIRSE